MTKREVLDLGQQFDEVIERLHKLSSTTLEKTGKPLSIPFEFNYCLQKNRKKIEALRKDTIEPFRLKSTQLQKEDGAKHKEELDKALKDIDRTKPEGQKQANEIQEKLKEKYKSYFDKLQDLDSVLVAELETDASFEFYTVDEKHVPKDVLTAKELGVVMDLIREEPIGDGKLKPIRKGSKK